MAVMYTTKKSAMMNREDKVSLKEGLLNDSCFYSLMERRLSETEDKPFEDPEKIALRSAVDYRLKYLNSMENRSEEVQKLINLCNKNRLVPQYDASGPPVYRLDKLQQSPDGAITANINPDGVYLILTNNMLTIVRLPLENEHANCLFSPHSEKIIVRTKDCIRIWSVEELRLIHESNVEEVEKMCWSGDGSTVLWVGKDKENRARTQFMYHLDTFDGTLIKKELKTFVQDMAMDDGGEVVLLLSHWGIDLLSVPDGEIIKHHECPCPISLYTQIGYANGVFFILNGGVVIGVDNSSVKIIEDCSKKIGQPVWGHKINDWGIEWQNSSLSLEENLVFILTSASIIRTFTMTREIDPVTVTDEARYTGQMGEKHLKRCLRNLRERSIYHIIEENSIKPYVHEEGEGRVFYLTERDFIIGYKIIKSTSRVCKYAYRRFIFRNGPPALFNYWQYLKSDRMKKYGPIPDPDTDIAWEEESREPGISLTDNRDTYFVETAPPVVIEDVEEFTWLTPQNLEGLEWEELGDGRNKSYIAFPIVSENVVYQGRLCEDSTHVLLLDENRVLLKEIQGGIRIKSANRGRIFYQSKGIIYSVDTETLEIREFAEHCPEKNGYVSFVSEYEESKLMVLPDHSVHIKTTSDGVFEKIDGIDPVSDNMVCLMGDQVVWIQSKFRMQTDLRQNMPKKAIEICSMNIVSKEKKVTDPNVSNNLWRPLSMGSDLKVPLIRINGIEKEKEKWWEGACTASLSFARLDLQNGNIKEYPNDPEFKLSVCLNGVEDIPKVIDWKNNITLNIRDEESSLYKRIALYKISKEGIIQSNNAITPNVSKLDTLVTILDDGRYVISTQGSDEDKEDRNNLGFRSVLRVMEPESGRKIRYNVSHSQGQLYGMPNYVMREGSKALSMNNGGYIVAESFGPDGAIINTWDIKAGDRFPKDESEPIMGRIVGKSGEAQIEVALTKGNQIVKTMLYDLKMRPVKGSDKEMHIPMVSHGERGIDYGDLTTEAIRGKEIEEIFVKMAFSGGGYNYALSEGASIIIPLRETKPREYDRKAPCPYAANNNHNEEGRTWVYLKAAIGTLRFGMISDIIEVDLELVANGNWGKTQVLTGGGWGKNIAPDQTKECEKMISECLKNLVLERVGKAYIIQQPYKKDNCQTKLEINCNLRILPLGGAEKIIEDVIGPSMNEVERKSSLTVSGGFVSFTQEKNGIARHVAFKDGLDNIEYVAYDICDADKFRPEPLYADDEVSIAYDSFKNTMLMTSKSKKAEKNMRIGSFAFLRNDYEGKLFNVNGEGQCLSNELEWCSSEASLTVPGKDINNTMQLFEERGVFTIVKKDHNL